MDNVNQIKDHLDRMEGEVRSWHASRASRAVAVKSHIEAIRVLIQPQPSRVMDSIKGFFAKA